MKILKPAVFMIIVMVVGKVCGYREELIISLVKSIIGFEILLDTKIIIKKAKNILELSIKFFSKN